MPADALRPYKLVIPALLLLCAAAVAADYRFAVPMLKMQVYPQPDASVRIVYDITFRNLPGAHPIDVVDIGLPHKGYSFADMRASIDGRPLSRIRRSEYIDIGVEVHLESDTIPPGGTGTLHFECAMPDLVYQDTTRGDYASLRITPTWFGRQFVTGEGLTQLAIHLPESIELDEVLYHNVPFDNKAVYQGRVVVLWSWLEPPTGPHLVGVSFPKRVMDRVVRMSKFQLLVKWFEDHPDVRLWAGLVFLVGFGFAFFRFSGGTGCSVFVVLAGLLGYGFLHRPAVHLLAFVPLIALLVLNEWYLRRRTALRRKRYLPPIAEVEGGGIKRGLTAPEAAALLELPLGRVVGLVLFGLLKKGVLRQIEADPLIVEVEEPFRVGPLRKGRERLLKAARERGVVIHYYEERFLFVIEQSAARTPVRELDFSGAIRALVRGVAARMKGFDISDTQDYYRRIVERAVQQAAGIGQVELKQKAIDRDLEWILMSDRYPPVLHRGGWSYEPTWTRGAGGGSVPSTPSAPSTTPVGGKTTFGDVAGSFAGWTENTMGQLATSLAPGSLHVDTPKGVLDLSGFDKVTGDVFEALAKSSGGGGGGGCACAGCACACACAGGGR